MRRTDTNRIFELLGGLSGKFDALKDATAEREASAAVTRVAIHTRLDEHTVRIDSLEKSRSAQDARQLDAEKRSAFRFKVLGALVGTVGLFGPLIRHFIAAQL